MGSIYMIFHEESVQTTKVDVTTLLAKNQTKQTRKRNAQQNIKKRHSTNAKNKS